MHNFSKFCRRALDCITLCKNEKRYHRYSFRSMKRFRLPFSSFLNRHFYFYLRIFNIVSCYFFSNCKYIFRFFELRYQKRAQHIFLNRGNSYFQPTTDPDCATIDTVFKICLRKDLIRFPFEYYNLITCISINLNLETLINLRGGCRRALILPRSQFDSCCITKKRPFQSFCLNMCSKLFGLRSITGKFSYNLYFL